MAKQSDLQNASQIKQKMLQELFKFEQETGSAEDLELVDKRDLASAPPTPEKTFLNPDGIVDIVTFCEHPYFLGLKLTPWQKLICKAFYSGTHGNTHLQIEKEKPETGCEGCVWKSHHEAETTYIKGIREPNKKIRPEEPSIKPENSPCLQCSRYNENDRKFYYEFQMQQSLNVKAKDEVTRLSERPIEDLHTTEWEMLHIDQVSERVRDQIINKWGGKFQELILVLGRRSGKAQDLKTPIYTPNGWSTMGQLKVGDYVFAPDGNRTKIIAKSEIDYKKQAYELVFSNGEKIIACEDHEWVTLTKAERKNASRGKYSKEPKPQVFTTKQIYESLTYGTPRQMLKKGSQTERRDKFSVEYNHAIEITKPLIFDEQNLTIHPYLLGVWLGDGSKSANVIAGIDIELFDYIQSSCFHSIIHNEHNRCIHRIKPHSITGESFISLLKKTNLYGNKHIPEIYKHSSIEQRMELLRGLNDTDGYVDPKKFTVEFCNTNETLAYDYYELVCGLGYKAVIKKSDAKLYGRKTSDRWRITYSVRPGDKVFNLSRKQQVLDNKKSIDKSDKYRVFIKECNPVKNPGMQCIQVDHPSSMYLCGRSMIPTHNSFMVSVIALYEVYRFLEMEHPQSRFPLTEFDTISIVNIANSQKQAKGAIFDKMRSYCFKSPYFSASVGKDIQGEIHFLTPHDKKENERRIAQGNSSLLTGTIQAISGHSNSSTLVGLTVAVVIIDEMAEMAGNNPEGNADEILYDKLKPALATFGSDGKMICISNPLGPLGKFHSLYESSFDDPLTLMFQLPTWLSNPTISKSWLDSEKAKSRKTFNIFYGAQFSSGAGDTFLNEDDVMRAFRALSDHRRLEFGEPLQRYYMHMDPAHSSDMYTLAIVHTVPMIGEIGPDGREVQKVIVDHIHYWEPKGPNQPVNQDEVDQYILRLAQRFHLVQVTYDQHWSSHASIARMKANGVPCTMTPYTGQFQREIYQNLYELFVNGRIEFYGINTLNCELPNGNIIALKDSTYARDQFLDLQRKYKGGGWKIEAPKGQKDDIPDCIAGAAFQALKDKVFSQLPKPRSISFNPWKQRL